MRISKATRAAAIRALDLAASNLDTLREDVRYSEDVSLTDAVYALAHHESTRALMGAAWRLMLDEDYAESLGSAAALLRDGWSPGDPVVRFGAKS